MGSPATQKKVTLSIEDVSKTYHTKASQIEAIHHISLEIYEGEFICLVGPSGCGKTTLLRLISGLERDYTGNIILDNRRIESPGLDRGMIFQEHRLFPWLNIRDNVGLGLRDTKARATEKVRYYLNKVGLRDFLKAYPDQLSGGMAQRAAIARALILEPEVLLLDEPFGALDAMTRIRMQEEIEKIWLAEKTTMILVTHDIEEAIFLGDRIVVMSDRPAQIDAVFDVPLPRTRDRSHPEFVELRKNIMSSFYDSSGNYVI